MKEENKISEKLLDAVAGGEVSRYGYDALNDYIRAQKKRKISLENAIKDFKIGWLEGSIFKLSFTDGLQEDCETCISYTKENWDKL